MNLRNFWIIILVGFALRLIGVHFGLPYLYHADEPIVVNHAMAFGTGDLNPHFFKIPPLVSYILFLCYGIYFLCGKIIGFFPSIDSYQFAFFIRPSMFYLIARMVFGVLLGTFTIAQFQRSMERHFDPRVALGASGLLAVCFLHVRDSHYVYADIPLVFILVVAFGIFWDIIDYPQNNKLYLKAGALIGIATAFKYNGAALVIPYLLTFFMAGKKNLRAFIWGLALIPVCFIVLNPFSVLDFSFFLKEISKQGDALGGAGWIHHAVYSLRGAAGFPVFFFSLIGLAAAVKSKNPKIWVFALFHLVYYAILALRGQNYDRYVLPMIPSMLFFTSYGIFQIAGVVKRGRKITYTILILTAAVPSLARCVLFDKIMLSKDNRTVAKEWVENHIPAGSPIALDWDFYMPRLLFSYEQLQEKRMRVQNDGTYSKTQDRRLYYLMNDGNESRPRYPLNFLSKNPAHQERFLFADPLVPYDVAELRRRGIQYVITGNFGKNPDASLKGFRDKLQSEGELVAFLTPYRNGDIRLPLDAQPLTGGPFLWEDLWQRERNGQPLEIYKLKQG